MDSFFHSCVFEEGLEVDIAAPNRGHIEGENSNKPVSSNRHDPWFLTPLGQMLLVVQIVYRPKVA